MMSLTLNGLWFFFHFGFGKVKILMLFFFRSLFWLLCYDFRTRDCWQFYWKCCFSKKPTISIRKWFVHSVQINADLTIASSDSSDVWIFNCWSSFEWQQAPMDSCIYSADSVINCQCVFLHLGHQATKRKKLWVGTFPFCQCAAICIYSVKTWRFSKLELGDHFCTDMDYLMPIACDDAVQFNIL